MSVELKIKAKHLAVEARIIRHQENKAKRWAKALTRRGEDNSRAREQIESMCNHRRGKLRRSARMTHLARAFMNNRPYKQVEQPKFENRLLEWDYILIGALVAKYAPRSEPRFHNIRNANKEQLKELVLEWTRRK